MFFNDINKVQVMGNVTKKPEVRYTPSGKAVMNFSVATNRDYKQGDEWKQSTEFHDITLWKNVETAEGYMEKGTRVLVEGHLQTRSWEKDGHKMYKTEIIADNVQLIARYKDRKDRGVTKAEDVTSETDIDPDDLPF